MIDFSKAYCSLHPHELVTNFCNKDQCLTPLCANCICTHTDAHVEKGTSPDYENIRTTYKKIQDNLHSQIHLFEEEKQRIVKICSKIEQKRRKLKDVVNMARDQLENFVRNYFEEKEKKMLRQIENEQKKRGLHCENRLQQMNSYISRQISSLISATEDMTSNNFLQSLPRIRTQVMTNSQALYKEVSKELSENENFTTTLTYDPSYLGIIQNMIEKSVQLIYSFGSMENKNVIKQQKKQVENIKMNPVINKNIQSQISFNKSKSDQYLSPNQMNKRMSYMNSQLNTVKENNVYHQINVKPPNVSQYERNSILEGNRNQVRNNSQSNFINKNVMTDPKISLLKVSQDSKLKNMSNNRPVSQNRVQNNQIMKFSKVEQNGQVMKKSRKSGLKVLTNNDGDGNYKMYQTQMM